MDEIEFMEVDDVWRILGRGGRYQVTQFLLLILSGTPMAFHVLSVVFIGRDTEHVCSDPREDMSMWSSSSHNITDNNLFLSLESCSIVKNDTDGGHVSEEPCTHGYNYSLPRDRSFMSEWDLVCDRETLAGLSQTLVMAGMMVGASLLPQIGDKYGRKTLNVSAHLTMFVVALVMAFNPNFTGFLFLRFVVGMCQQGYIIPMFIHMIELFPAAQREMVGLVGNLLWAISIILVTLIGFLTRNYSWRTMQIILAVFSAVTILDIWLLDESLRWLVANKKSDAVTRIIKKAARMNRKDFTKIWQTVRLKSEVKRMLHISQTGHQSENVRLLGDVSSDGVGTTIHPVSAGTNEEVVKSKRAFGYLDLLKNSTLRPYALIMCYAWMTNSLTYYGLTLLSSKLAGNVYVNFLLGGVLEIPATFLLFILLKRIGRKKTLIFFHLTATTCLLVAVLVSSLAGDSPVADTCMTVFSLGGRFAISGSFNAVWVYAPELFPTNIRNVGLGLSSSAARAAGMASPFLNSLARIAVWGPGAIFSAMCLLVTVLISFLPETTGRELPQTVEELQAWKSQGKKEKERRKEKSDTEKADEFRFEKI